MAEQESIEILLIDDNADFPVLIRRALENRDPRYRVTSVASPEEGEALLEKRPFDLVLLDYRFPRGVNGLQVIRKLKCKATYVPTVMVTAFGDEGLAIQAMREGALDFVPKASDFIQALPDVAGRAIERGRIIRERIATQRALEQRNRELLALSDITSAINASLDADAILDVATAKLGELFGAAGHEVHQVEQEMRQLIRLGRGASDAPDGAVSRAVAEGTVVVENGARGASSMVVPLIAGSRATGAITLRLPPGTEVSPAEQALAASIGQQVGIALERARLHGALGETRGRLQDLVDNAADEVVTLDADGRIQSWNNGAEAIYGWTAEEVVGAGWEMLWPSERHGEAQRLAREVAGGATIKTHETVRRTKDGAPLDILLTLTPLAVEGASPGISCLGKNVTMLKQLQAQLVQSEKMAVVGQLISGVAHELNNPLTSVLGYAQLMAEVDVGPKRDRYLERITSEAGRCPRIVNPLLSFARKHEPRTSRVDINQMVRESVDLRSYDLRVTNIALDVKLADKLPSTFADGHQLQHVLINILTNAQQAMKDRESGRILVTTAVDESEPGSPVIVISLADDGPGIPEALREKVFEPFFTTKPVGEGTGLGLSLSYGIVQQHCGEIAVVDSPLGGACFQIRLPVIGGAPARPAQAEERPALAPTPRAEAARRRVLVVDDQAPVREMVSEALAPLGYDVVTAQDGREALDLIVSGADPFDLVIADLRMPEFGGDRLWRQVKRFAPEVAERMVFASGDVSSDALGFLGGASNRFMAKPFGAEDVRSTVDAFFRDKPEPARAEGKSQS